MLSNSLLCITPSVVTSVVNSQHLPANLLNIVISLTACVKTIGATSHVTAFF